MSSCLSWGGAVEARRAHNPEVDGSSPSPTICVLALEVYLQGSNTFDGPFGSDKIFKGMPMVRRYSSAG